MTTNNNTQTNREIKFRAWDKVDNIMKYSRPYAVITPYYGFFGDVRHSGYIEITQKKAKTGHNNTVVGYSGDLMQYTGLKDKNGKEIYEGDVVIVKNNYPLAVVKYGEFYTDNSKQEYDFIQCYGWYYDFVRQTSDIYYFDGSFTSDCEVIGNIHENPELLKEEN